MRITLVLLALALLASIVPVEAVGRGFGGNFGRGNFGRGNSRGGSSRRGGSRRGGSSRRGHGQNHFPSFPSFPPFPPPPPGPPFVVTQTCTSQANCPYGEICAYGFNDTISETTPIAYCYKLAGLGQTCGLAVSAACGQGQECSSADVCVSLTDTILLPCESLGLAVDFCDVGQTCTVGNTGDLVEFEPTELLCRLPVGPGGACTAATYCTTAADNCAALTFTCT